VPLSAAVRILLVLILFVPSIALSAEPVAPSPTPIFIPSELIIPYDRLGRDNVTIRAQQNGGGNDVDYRYRARWGSYVRSVTSTKDIEVTILQRRKAKQPLRVEFFFVIKGEEKRYAKQAGALDLPEGEGTAVFSTTAKQNQARWVYLGVRERSGERIEAG
jgi:hypothetical protein